jgi:hypothetical protein
MTPARLPATSIPARAAPLSATAAGHGPGRAAAAHGAPDAPPPVTAAGSPGGSRLLGEDHANGDLDSVADNARDDLEDPRIR